MKKRKGILLAGGKGSRLYPITASVNKHLLAVYDKPMYYYSLSILMLAGIREILIISTPQDLPQFKKLLGNGTDFGLILSYKIQPSPDGLAQAFILGEKFIGDDNVCLILGDNIFYGKTLPELLKRSLKEVENSNCSKIFGYYVNQPERYGVMEVDKDLKPISIEEKPKNPRGDYAVVGLYYYKNDVINIAKNVTPSNRGELEITSINSKFLEQKRLSVEILDSIFWLDTGTHDSIVEASSFIKTIENREGKMISCLEEIAYKYNYISKDELKIIIDSDSNNSEYLNKLIEHN